MVAQVSWYLHYLNTAQNDTRILHIQSEALRDAIRCEHQDLPSVFSRKTLSGPTWEMVGCARAKVGWGWDRI